MKRVGFIRILDVAVLKILAAINVLNGFYLIGPWYIQDRGVHHAPLYALFGSHATVIVFGALLMVNGLILWGAVRPAAYNVKAQTVLKWSLLGAFLLKLYSLIGVFLALDGLLPPSYISQAAIVLIFGIYWLGVKRHERLST